MDKATLVRLGETGWTDNLDEDQRGEIFNFGELLAVSGIAARRYFDDGWGLRYSNRDHYRLIIQSFEDPAAGVALVTRRRDGTNTNARTATSYIVQRPEHVTNLLHVPMDVPLLEALLQARDTEAWPAWFDAIIGFNAANTDGSQVSEQMEVVLTVGALERLLVGHGGQADKLAAGLLSALTPSHDITPADCPRTAADPFKTQFQKCATVREAWIRDLYRARNDFAHGRAKRQRQEAWTRHEHLLLASYIFPRLVKLALADARRYVLTADDLLDIDAFEQLACADLFATDEDDRAWPWTTIRDRVRRDALHRKLVEALNSVDHPASSVT